MRRTVAFLGVFTSAFVDASGARAELRFSADSLNDGTNIVIVSGEISSSDRLDEFVSLAASRKASMVVFDSPGGNIYGAMKLGRMIRALQLNTVQIRQMDCASACALAFVGGVRRSATPGSIGVHRSSFAPSATMGREDAVAGVQEVTADILSYLGEMGVSAKFLEFSLRYDSADMRYLSGAEMAELNVTTTSNQADIPASFGRSSQPETPVAVQPDDGIEKAATDFVRMLIEQNSGNDFVALGTVRQHYAPAINYYEKGILSQDEVLADKQAYLARWPERGYRIRDSSLMATCANGACMVSGIYDWTVRSIPRNKQARGAARFTYTIQLGVEPKVISEGGQIVRK